MNASQTRLVLLALVVGESAWVYAVLGVLGLWMGQDSSPLGWPTIVVLLVASLYVGKLGPSEKMDPRAEILVRMLIGVLIVYVAIAVELSENLPFVDVLWLFKAFSASEPDRFWFTFLAGGLAGTALWVRGGKLGVAAYPTDQLALSFRIGIPALIIATLVDLFNEADLNTFLMVFIFFGATLGGLTSGHLLPRSRTAMSNIWPWIVVAVVAIVVVIGLAFTVVPGAVLDIITWPLRQALTLVALVFAWVVLLPAAFLIDSVAQGLIWLYNLLFGGGTPPPSPQQEAQLATTTPAALEAIEGTGANIWIGQILLGLALGLAAAVLLYVGAKVFRRPASRRVAPVEGQRESVMEDADPLIDLANLLWSLRPSWLKRRRGDDWLLPDGLPGIVKVLEIYYDLLLLAEERGVLRQPHETTGELAVRMAEILPGDLVHRATAAFGRAFYGLYPSSEDDIAEMRAAVDGLAAEPA